MDRPSRNASLALLTLLAPYLWLVNRYWFVCDDAFITFRYSQNWAQGYGPRYNLGDHVPVEGYSNFLWMAIATLFEAAQIPPHTVMPYLSAACGVALLSLLYRTLLVHGRTGIVLAWAATAIAALFPPFAVWSTSGLATMPLSLFLFAAWAVLALEDHRRVGVTAGFAGLLLALTRTEGIAWVVVVGVLAAGQRWMEKRPVRQPIMTYAGIAGIGYAAYFAWRYGYYQSLAANTAYAKVHLQPATLVRGMEYLALYATTLITPALLLLAVPASVAWSRRQPMALTAGLLALGVPAYAVAVSGDYMAWFRILVPGVAFMAVSIGLALRAVAERWQAPPVGAALAAVLIAALGLAPGFDQHLVPAGIRKPYNVRDKLGFFRSENEQWEAMGAHVDAWTEKGHALGGYARPGDTYVAAAIGATGYYSGVFIYDRNGLVNREVAMQPWNGELRSPGHDKVVDRSFFYDQEPTILDSKIVVGPKITTKIRYALREMEVNEVRHLYYPEIVEMPKPEGRVVRRVLLPLRRGHDAEDVARGWQAFEESLAAFDKRAE